jgi:hypothetical protein
MHRSRGCPCLGHIDGRALRPTDRELRTQRWIKELGRGAVDREADFLRVGRRPLRMTIDLSESTQTGALYVGI